MIPSNIRQYIGIAATAIENNNDRILEVYCPEFAPFKVGVDGKATTKVAPLSVIDNETGEKVPVSINMADTIKCEYLGENTNMDIPDIHIGELIKVTNFGGDEKFYWSCLDRKDYIRHVEHWRLSVADQRKTNKELTDDNTYFIDIDTRNHKRVLISTSNTDKEAFRYTILIDAIANQITLKDDAGNIIRLDSNIPRIYMLNNTGTLVDLNGPNLIQNVPGNMSTTVMGDYTIEVTGDYKRATAGNETLECPNTQITNATQRVVKAGKYIRQANEHDIKGAIYNVVGGSGDVVVAGKNLGFV